jgi:anti-sigma factor RsiW
MTEEPTELDLHAYIDDQLDIGDRFAVEAHLGDHPEQAARVMSELSSRTALRLLARGGASAPSQLLTQTQGLTPRRPANAIWRRAVPIGGVAVAIAVVALLLVRADQPPAYIDMALASHRIALMRANMTSQVEAPELNPQEILANTRIRLPALPADWRITDVQLFPGGDEPALLIAVRTGDGQVLTLFAIRERSGAPNVPDTVREHGHSVAYWRRGDMSYALVGEQDLRLLDQTAEGLNRS